VIYHTHTLRHTHTLHATAFTRAYRIDTRCVHAGCIYRGYTGGVYIQHTLEDRGETTGVYIHRIDSMATAFKRGYIDRGG